MLQPVSLLSLPAKCELDTDRFLPQSGFLLDKQDPGHQAHNPSSNLVKLVMWLLTEIYFDLPFFEFSIHFALDLKCLLHICQSVTRRKTGVTACKSSPSPPRAPLPHTLARPGPGNSRSSGWDIVKSKLALSTHQVCWLARKGRGIMRRCDHYSLTRRWLLRFKTRSGYLL